MHELAGFTRHEEKAPPLFKTRALSFQYPDGRQALQGIDLAIYPGDRVALAGVNGSGKSTLAKHLIGLLSPTSGDCFYKERPLSGDTLTHVRREVGILFQDPDDHLFCNTIYDDIAFGPMNLGCGPKEVKRRVEKALSDVGLEKLAYRQPHTLSLGQKKRAAFAAVIAMQPDVLILDEPTANLDPKQKIIFQKLLQKFSGTLICISHFLPFVHSLCKRAVVMAEGRIHHDFSLNELIAHQEALREHGLDHTFRFNCCGSGDHHHHTDHSHPHSPRAPLNKKSTQQERAGLIRMRNYSFEYPDRSQALHTIDITIHHGESVAIVGENGAGKTTLASCLMGILRGRGEYLFQGNPVSDSLRKRLWQHIGMVFQDSSDQIFCPSCEEEVSFGPEQMQLEKEEIKKRLEDSLRLTGLKGYEKRVPLHLSGGERKRLAIAAAYSMLPPLLILDEPTANLDPESEKLLISILNDLDITKIVISHDMSFIAHCCERTLVMDQGRIVKDSKTAEFLGDNQLVSLNMLDYTYKNICAHG